MVTEGMQSECAAQIARSQTLVVGSGERERVRTRPTPIFVSNSTILTTICQDQS